VEVRGVFRGGLNRQGAGSKEQGAGSKEHGARGRGGFIFE